MAFLVILGFLLAASWQSVASADTARRYVFGHYMVCCSFDGREATVDQLEAEMRKALRFGIDGFALNCGGWHKEPIYPQVSEKLFAAADRLGGAFKLFFSADSSSGLAPEEAMDMVTRFRAHPSYLHVDSRPVLSTWGGSVSWSAAIRDGLAQAGVPIFFVPHIAKPTGFPITGFQTETPTRWTVNRIAANVRDQGFDGLFYFGAAGRYQDIVTSTRAFADAFRDTGRIFMAPVTPFYRGLGGNFRVFESDGFVGMQAQWRAAIESGANWVEVVTWNDWGEATYVYPFEGADWLPLGRGHWGKLLAHDGFLSASRYYIDWFKQGRAPDIERNEVFFFYRIHPKAVEGIKVIEGEERGWPTFVERLDDVVQIVTLLRQRATVTVAVGDRRTALSAEPGLSIHSVPFAEGKVSIDIEHAGGSRHVDLNLEISRHNYFGNFNYFSGAIDF